MWFDESREIKLIELDNNGFNKVVRIRVENIKRLKHLLLANGRLYSARCNRCTKYYL